MKLTFIMSNIIANLPSELQVNTFQFLVKPNERVILVGNPGVGKTIFIRRIKKSGFSPRYSPSKIVQFNKINRRVSIAELGGLWRFSSAYTKVANPTRIIIMADVTSGLSIKDVILVHLPRCREYNLPITIIFNKTDIPRVNWKHRELEWFTKKMATISSQYPPISIFLTSMKENGDICLTPHFDYLIEF